VLSKQIARLASSQFLFCIYKFSLSGKLFEEWDEHREKIPLLWKCRAIEEWKKTIEPSLCPRISIVSMNREIQQCNQLAFSYVMICGSQRIKTLDVERQVVGEHILFG
jgi:hypothetical protein